MYKALSIVVIAALAACAKPDAQGSDPVAGIRAADTAMQQAVAAKNLEAIVALYADDAVLLPTAEPMVEGKQAIRKEWEHILAIPDFANTSQLRDAKVSGDLGYTYGTYRAEMMGEDGNSVEEPGKWVTVWRRGADGKWLVAVDTYNTDVPPPDHK